MFLELFFKIFWDKLNEKSSLNNKVISKIMFQIKKMIFTGIIKLYSWHIWTKTPLTLKVIETKN